MHWIKVTNPEYQQSRQYRGQVGEVVGKWGRDNTVQRDGYLVEFADGEIVGVSRDEVEEVVDPDVAEPPRFHARRCS